MVEASGSAEQAGLTKILVMVGFGTLFFGSLLLAGLCFLFLYFRRQLAGPEEVRAKPLREPTPEVTASSLPVYSAPAEPLPRTFNIPEPKIPLALFNGNDVDEVAPAHAYGGIDKPTGKSNFETSESEVEPEVKKDVKPDVETVTATTVDQVASTPSPVSHEWAPESSCDGGGVATPEVRSEEMKAIENALVTEDSPQPKADVVPLTSKEKEAGPSKFLTSADDKDGGPAPEAHAGVKEIISPQMSKETEAAPRESLAPVGKQDGGQSPEADDRGFPEIIAHGIAQETKAGQSKSPTQVEGQDGGPTPEVESAGVTESIAHGISLPEVQPVYQESDDIEESFEVMIPHSNMTDHQTTADETVAHSHKPSSQVPMATAEATVKVPDHSRAVGDVAQDEVSQTDESESDSEMPDHSVSSGKQKTGTQRKPEPEEPDIETLVRETPFVFSFTTTVQEDDE